MAAGQLQTAGAVQCSAVQRSAVQCSAAQAGASRSDNTEQHRTTQEGWTLNNYFFWWGTPSHRRRPPLHNNGRCAGAGATTSFPSLLPHSRDCLLFLVSAFCLFCLLYLSLPASCCFFLLLFILHTESTFLHHNARNVQPSPRLHRGRGQNPCRFVPWVRAPRCVLPACRCSLCCPFSVHRGNFYAIGVSASFCELHSVFANSHSQLPLEPVGRPAGRPRHQVYVLSRNRQRLLGSVHLLTLHSCRRACP